ncbi:MAG: SDR family oxidoreductase [Pseudomonadota bacterium]
MTYADQAAVITGGGSGIGAALGKCLVEQGAYVILADIDGDAAKGVAADLGPRAHGVQCDVSDMAAVDALAEASWVRHGRIDLVFANAGIGLNAPLLKATLAQYEATLGVNLRGVWLTAAAFARHMVQDGGGGHICLTGSEHSLGMQHTGNGLYTASKHAVLGLGDVLRHELAGQVNVSVLCPGLVQTGIVDGYRHFDVPHPPEDRLAVGRAVMAEGLDPEIVARETLAAMARKAFLIVTHPMARKAAETRWQEIDTAFATQPPQDGSRDAYEVDEVVARVLAARDSG